MTTKIKKPRKGSGRWLAWAVAGGGELKAERVNAAMPWKYTLKTNEVDVGVREHAISGALIQRLAEQRVLRGVLQEVGPFAWNLIVYIPGDQCDAYCDGDED